MIWQPLRVALLYYLMSWFNINFACGESVQVREQEEALMEAGRAPETAQEFERLVILTHNFVNSITTAPRPPA